MFAQNLPAWKFKGYQCVGIENARETQERLHAKGLDHLKAETDHVELTEIRETA